MDYIRSFNREIEQQRLQKPDNSTINVILRYKAERGYKDYYSTIDSMMLIVGIEYTIQTLLNSAYETVGYLPCIKYSPDNPLGHESGIFPLIRDEESIKSLAKAYTFAAKEHFYRLMLIPNLEELVFSVSRDIKQE